MHGRLAKLCRDQNQNDRCSVILYLDLIDKTFQDKESKKQVSMISKYHNHTLQTNPRNREEEPQNTDCHKECNQLSLSLSHDAKLDRHKVLNNKARTKHRTPTANGSNNKQVFNNKGTTALERTAA